MIDTTGVITKAENLRECAEELRTVACSMSKGDDGRKLLMFVAQNLELAADAHELALRTRRFEHVQ